MTEIETKRKKTIDYNPKFITILHTRTRSERGRERREYHKNFVSKNLPNKHKKYYNIGSKIRARACITHTHIL